MTSAMEDATPLPERIETVYKTGYRTGFRNGQKRLAEVVSAARLVAERFTEGDLLAAAAVYRLRQALTAFDDYKRD